MKVAQSILTGRELYNGLRRQNERAWCSDESYFRTLVKSDASLKIKNTFTTYVQWANKTDQRPQTLGMDHLQVLRNRHEHFARKFEFEAGTELNLKLDELSAN